ncbi:DUF1302 family protein [Pyruvatibacter mobilis]|uniref:DUF1302 domain-containing protein n=1 Tax=Pyruvatibacter mobilis TaxID=1712261 RepID=UPI003C79B9A3
MTTRTLRSALLGSAVGVGLLASGGQALALSTELGEVKIFFDTTVSIGAQMSVANERRGFLSEANGGNPGPNTQVLNGAAASALGVTGTITTNSFTFQPTPAGAVAPVQVVNNPDLSYGASINGDDGILNFDSGDLTSANIKATHDIQATWRNFTLFSRVTEFYDFIQARDDGYNRSGIDRNNIEEVGRDIRLLDLYVSGDFDVGSLPVNIRAGKQVISWGEGTFIFNGVNVINPVDVSAFRRPGVEIKEGLLPVWALYGSVGLPFDLSLEAFYQLDWEPFQLDVAGTHFAGSDAANPNSSFGGNQGIGFYSGSAFPNSVRQNCAGSGFEGLTALSAAGGGLTALLPAPLQPGAQAAAAQALNAFPGCVDGSFRDFDTALTVGRAEQELIALNPLLGTRRGADQDPDDSGQWGVALRWYSEDLNSTEFGFYYVNYHSRLPYAQVAPTVGALPQVILGSESASGSLSSKGTRGAGCASFLGGANAGLGGAAPATPAGQFQDPNMPNLVNVAVSDPNNIIGNLAGFADTILTAAANPAAGTIAPSVAANGANAFDAARINCALFLATSSGGLVIDGEPVIGLQQDLTTTLVYPEDIQMWGISFNTTIGDWGVQGEFTFRPNMPFQTDTDQQTIAAAGSGQCSGVVGFGDALGGVRLNSTTSATGTSDVSLNRLSTSPLQAGFDVNSNCNIGNIGQSNPAFVREEMFTFQIGTTATYTNSNPLIDFLGADIGILVTEFGLVHVPDVPDEVTNTGAPQDRFYRFQNVCVSGTDLPLGGVLALDNRSGCRATETSYGVVLLTRLDYNNAFGSAWTISPQISYRHDLEGFTPAPVSNFSEDRKTLGLSVSANYQNQWRLTAGYTNFMGKEKYHRNLDQDFVSLSASYSF